MAPADALEMDIRNDLERVDRVVTQIVSDPATGEEFIRDPSRVLVRLGLHPPTTPEIHDRVNNLIYAVLTNVELVSLLLDHFATFEAPVASGIDTTIHNEGLARGVIEHAIELDLAAADHVLRRPDVLRQVYRLTLYDLNNRRLLQNVYTTEQLNQYIDSIVESIQARRSIRDEPKLET